MIFGKTGDGFNINTSDAISVLDQITKTFVVDLQDGDVGDITKDSYTQSKLLMVKG